MAHGNAESINACTLATAPTDFEVCWAICFNKENKENVLKLSQEGPQ